jgi:putative ABC transport system permease protein
MRPRSIKILRDLRLSYGRVGVMIIAIAVAVTGFGAILVAKESLTRDASAAYAGTNPAAATLDLPEGVSPELLADVRELPGVADATARQTVSTRVQVDGGWLPLRLFVVAPSDPMRIAHFTVETGGWPSEGMLLERAAVNLLGASRGDSLRIENSSGVATSVAVDGTVWDPALAPATQERTGYAFVTPAFIESLGFEAVNDRLLITVVDAETGLETRDQATVDAVASSVAEWLTGHGHAVHEVTAPPFHHPHQNQTDTVTNLLLAFALAALALAAVLVASTLGGMLAAQTRQIGIMKTVGASTATVVGLYLTMTSAIAGVATLVALAPGIAAGRGLAGLVGSILNLDISSAPPGVGIIVAIVAAGVVVPVLVGMVPILRAARVTVREAIGDFEVSKAGTRRIDRLLTRLGAGDRLGGFAIRGLGRRPQRFIATVALLAAGGGLFLAGINSSEAWQRWVDDGLSRRSYDVQLSFTQPVPEAALAAALDDVDGWESLSSLPATPSNGNGGVLIQRIYPDGGHGVFSATAIDADTRLVDFAVREGHWLRDGERDAVVLNQAAATRLGDPRVGDSATLSIEGYPVEWAIVGIVDEVGGPATAYVDRDSLDGALGSPGMATAVRLVGDQGSAAVIAALAAQGITVSSIVPTTELKTAIDNHVVVFIAVLIALALLMAIIGALGLASSMSMSVIERTREFGIMKAIGASPGFVRRLVLTEGALTGGIGFAIAAVLSVPVSAIVGSTLGRLAFNLPLPLVISAPALVTWLVVAVLGAVLASLAAAQRSARLSVRQSLSHQ